MAGEKGHRVALPNSRVMIHAGSAGFPRSSLPDLEIMAREFSDIRERMVEIYHRHTGQPVGRISDDLERDYFMSPEEARNYGLIDAIVEPRQSGRFKGE
jgi:ATP-dependent Clp protease protease subunit